MLRVAALLAACLACVACRSGTSVTGDNANRETPTQAASAFPRPPGVSTSAGTARRPVFIRGPSGGEPIAPYVASQLAAARGEGRGVLVYVGATWCEPCQRFHHAVEAGELNDLLTGLNLLEFDLDADRDALRRDGYASELIPLFVSPNDDGTASSRRLEGSIKGPDAVARNLAPRLQSLLAATRR